MPTHDYIIANGTGAAVRADINAALSAIVSLNSSASEPGTMYAYQLWADTTSNLLKIRNSANSAWITLRQLDGDFSIVAVEDGLQATPSLTFTNDLNTGIFRPGNDSLSIVTNALRAITITSTQAVGIQTANPSTALHVAGNARVGADDTTDAHLQIGKGATGNRNSYIDIVGDTTYTDYGVRLIRNNGGADATSEIKHRGTGAFNIVTQEAAPIVFNTTNSPRLTILPAGNVGIGTSSPGESIHTTGKLRVGDGGNYTVAAVQLGTSNANGISYPGTNILNFITNSTAALTIDASQRVGIGTTGPAQELHVQASSGSGNIRVGGSAGLEINFDTSASTTSQIKSLYSTVSAAAQLKLVSGFLTFHTGTSNLEKARIDADGRLLVGTTTQVANVNGGILQLGSGITFPATAVAASDANTLDDYEEGTWTPTIAGDGTAFVGTTYFARAGLYRKIGSLVYVSYDIDVNQAGTLADNASIGNLPFPVPNNTNLSNGGGSIGYIAGIQQNYVYQSNYPQNNSSYLFIIGRTAASNQTGFFSSSNFFANNIRITGQAWYSV